MFPYLENQLNVTKVKTVLGKEISAEEIIAEKPDVVICATGVVPAPLKIEGIKQAISAKEVLDGAQTGSNVVIIGGGVTGCETAELLAMSGKKVSIVELMDSLAEKMVTVNRVILISHLKHLKVDMHTGCACQKISESNVIVKKKDKTEFTIPANTVILSTGDKPNKSLYESLINKVPELYNVEDSNMPDSIASSVHDGYYTALSL